MSKTCEMQCCKLKQAEYKINLMRAFLKSPEYHKVSKNFYTINDELTKIANKLL